jgi:hypothetical protein
MPRKASDEFLLIEMFKPVWSQHYQGEDYDTDGRDWREAKGFLQMNPDIFEKREIFIQRAMKFVDDDFWYKPTHGIRHQCHYLLKHYTRYSNAKPLQSPKSVSEPKRQMIHCCTCDKDHYADEFCEIVKRQ